MTTLVSSTRAWASCCESWFDGLHDALSVFDLIDSVLQLMIEHAPVTDDYDAIEDFLVGSGVQAGEAVRKP